MVAPVLAGGQQRPWGSHRWPMTQGTNGSTRYGLGCWLGFRMARSVSGMGGATSSQPRRLPQPWPQKKAEILFIGDSAFVGLLLELELVEVGPGSPEHAADSLKRRKGNRVAAPVVSRVAPRQTLGGQGFGGPCPLAPPTARRMASDF